MKLPEETAVWRFAISNQLNVILMTGALAFSLAFLSPWPALVGVAGEVIFLAVGLRAGPFRRWADRQLTQQHQRQLDTQAEEEERRLDPTYIIRVEALAAMVAEIRTLAAERGLDPTPFDDDGLGSLLGAFKRMAVMHQRLTHYLAEVPAIRLTEERQRLEGLLAQESDQEARASLAQAIALGQRRLVHHERTEGRRRALETRMDTAERSLVYLRAHLVGGGTEEELRDDVEEVLASAVVNPVAARSAPAASVPRETAIGLGKPPGDR
jgi:hypothetical protein